MAQRGVSFSQISMGIDCLYKLKLRYVDKCKGIEFMPDAYAVGKAVHDSADLYYKNWYLDAPIPNDVLYYIYEEFKKLWNPELPIADFQKAYLCLQNFANWEAARANKFGKPHIELKLDEVGYFGYVDGFQEENEYAWDLKTPKGAGLSKGYKRQAIVYKKMLDSKFKVDLKTFDFNFLYPNEIKTVDFSDKKVLELMDEVEELKDTIQECFRKWKFPKNPRTLKMCNWCDLRFYCKELRL